MPLNFQFILAHEKTVNFELEKFQGRNLNFQIDKINYLSMSK